MKITIRAEEGMWLTDGENFCKTADLGKGRSTEEFVEITQEEYNKIMGMCIPEGDTEGGIT